MHRLAPREAFRTRAAIGCEVRQAPSPHCYPLLVSVRASHAARLGLRGPVAALLLGLGSLRVGAADSGDVVNVSTVAELQRAAAEARPGTHIRIAPGRYAGGLSILGLLGAPGRPVVLEAADPKRPPLFEGHLRCRGRR